MESGQGAPTAPGTPGTPDLSVQPASAADIRRLVEWAAEEGWNPGDGDEAAFFPTDPGGFLVGRLDGEPVTSISAVRYGADYGFVGMYIARPAVRGRGYGFRTWQAGMQRLTGRNIGLDGVTAQQDNYRKFGFRHAWNTIRFRGVPDRIEPAAGVTLVDARTIGFAELARYDRRFFPADRDAFLAIWISLPNHHALAAVRDGRLVGLGVLRPAREVARVGPLYASDADVAGALLAGLTAGAEHEPIIVDVPDINEDAVRAVERAGFEACWETARMYTGGTPDLDLPGMYAVTTLELG